VSVAPPRPAQCAAYPISTSDPEVKTKLAVHCAPSVTICTPGRIVASSAGAQDAAGAGAAATEDRAIARVSRSRSRGSWRAREDDTEGPRGRGDDGLVHPGYRHVRTAGGWSTGDGRASADATPHRGASKKRSEPWSCRSIPPRTRPCRPVPEPLPPVGPTARARCGPSPSTTVVRCSTTSSTPTGSTSSSAVSRGRSSRSATGRDGSPRPCGCAAPTRWRPPRSLRGSSETPPTRSGLPAWPLVHLEVVLRE
jgi:hypothetical protein